MAQGVILFSSIHFALRAEKLFKEKALPAKLIPVPRHLSSDCGVCLRIDWEQREEIQKILEKDGIKIEGFYELTEKK